MHTSVTNIQSGIQLPIPPALFPDRLELSPAIETTLAMLSQINFSPIPPRLFPDHLELSSLAAKTFVRFSRILKRDLNRAPVDPCEKIANFTCSYSQNPFTLENSFCVANEKIQETILVEDFYIKAKVTCLKQELPEGTIAYSKELSPAINKILQSKDAYSLLKKALEDGPLTFLSADAEAVPSGGIFMSEPRYIYIARTKDQNEQTGQTLYEICDALNSNLIHSLTRDVEEGKVSKEAYVEKWEKIQFDSFKIFTSKINDIITKDLWAKETDLGFIKKFEQYSEWPVFWKSIKNSDHAIKHRLDWKKLYKKNYCSKHPKAIDCR